MPVCLILRDDGMVLDRPVSAITSRQGTRTLCYVYSAICLPVVGRGSSNLFHFPSLMTKINVIMPWLCFL